MERLPIASDIARKLPGAIADAGGSISVRRLEDRFGTGSGLKMQRGQTAQEAEYLKTVLFEAIAILVRSAAVELSQSGLLSLTSKGWAQASTLRSHPDIEPARHVVPLREQEHAATIDVSGAEPIVRYQSREGTVVTGYLRDAARAYHGRVFVPPASTLVDALYSAEIDGKPFAGGYYSALKQVGAIQSAIELLESKCHVVIAGLERETRSSRANGIRHIGRGGRPGRKASWERLVCEALGELGGHGDWQSITEALANRPAAEENRSWREEARQALRNHTSPRGRSYFEVADLGDKAVYTLTEQGQRLAAKRSEDERAPTLSKLFAKVTADETTLTDFELYALLHLAAELGKPAEARAIYHRLPEDFPDEDRYYLAGHLVDRAEELRKDSC